MTSQSDNLPHLSWNNGEIVLGTVYNIFHSEYPSDADFFAQVDIDLGAIRNANIRYLLVFPMSEWDPATKSLKWSRTDYLVAKMEELGIRFVPLMLKEEQCGHYFPIWKFEELEEIRRQHHQVGDNRNNREHVDFMHPDVFPAIEAYFKAVIERYGKSPNLAFYNIWNEPHYSHQSPHVIERFRNWLRSKYGSLSELRRAWGDDFTSWEQVTPFLADDWDSSMPSIDWILFRNELNGTILGELRTMLHHYDRSHAINANPVGTTWNNFGDFGSYNTDNWQFTPYEDFAGLSYYPDALESPRQGEPFPAWMHNLTFTVARSAAGEKPFILTELYTNGKSGLTLGGWLDKATVWQLAWIALANDCKGIFYWKWQPFARGRQALGRGLTAMDGTLAPRGEAVRELGTVISKWGSKLFEANLAKPRVALMLDMNGLLKCLEQHPQRGLRHFLYESNAGLFRVLDKGNHSVDFLRADLPLLADTLAAYSVIILPFQIVMRREVASMLKQYVANGGCLIADCMCASLDELDFAYTTQPGADLHEVFGARRQDWIAEEKYHRVRWEADGVSDSFDASIYREVLLPTTDAEIIASFADNGAPAAVRNRYGAGLAILLGFGLGGSLYRNESSALESILLGILEKQIGPAPFNWSSEGPTPMIRYHVRGDDALIYLINTTQIAVEGCLELPDKEDFQVHSWVDPSTISGPVPNQSAALQLKVKLAPANVQVLYVCKSLITP